MKNDKCLISTAFNYNIAQKRMDYYTFTIYHIIEHCLVELLSQQIDDFDIVSRISGRTSNYNLNIEINTYALPYQLDQVWMCLSAGAMLNYDIFSKQKQNVMEELSHKFSPATKKLISINSIMVNRVSDYPSLDKISKISYNEFIDEYQKLLFEKTFISLCYNNNTFLQTVFCPKEQIISKPLPYEDKYVVNTDGEETSKWVALLLDVAGTLSDFIYNEVTLNCLIYLLKSHFCDFYSSFSIMYKANDNVGSYLLVITDDEDVFCKKLIDAFTINRLERLLSDEVLLNIVGDYKINTMLNIETCRHRNRFVQKVHCCWDYKHVNRITEDMNEILNKMDRMIIIAKVIKAFENVIKYIFV